MSATLTRTATGPATRVVILPVGARFPRRPAATTVVPVSAPTLVREFPVGAKFPRRSAVERAARVIRPTGGTTALPPVGAKFPRRSWDDLLPVA